jgi:predicted CXXCH cytochrome family protein
MTRKFRHHPSNREPSATPPVAAAPQGKRGLLIVCGLIVAAVIAAIAFHFAAPKPPSSTPAPDVVIPVSASTVEAGPASYVGASGCQTCHEPEFKAWSGSHHDLAMQEANAATVLGDFADMKFRHRGVESHFFRRGDKFMVRTDGPDGKLTDYEIAYTFGVYPLQQYLIAFPGGRYQALPIAWDSRPKEKNGQRWFHLQPERKVDHQDPLHWTGNYQNWALQCAECHSTDLRKGYDAATNTYMTTYAEINVACEACHGPGSRHVEWAGKAKPPYTAQDDKGLPRFASHWREAWKFPTPDARFAVRDRPADHAGMNVCAACHARRGTLSEARQPGAPLEDTHRLAMLTAPNYHADGQQREEVYVWGSFLQSKMHQNGVTCMDCHEPHSLKLRAEGNALCTRCHNAAEFDAPKHHRHIAGGKGAQCVTCHMPTQNYMVIHARQDHSLRVPRPDLSQSLGSPNACTQCHTDRKPEWAASAMDIWYGKAWRERPSYGPALHAGTTLGALALPGLLDLARNPAAPAIIRATAITLAQSHVTPATVQAARELAKDKDPSLRMAALGLLAPLPPDQRVAAAAPLLADPVRGVRIDAARILADIPEDRFPVDLRSARAAAMQEYLVALDLEADWPSGRLSLGDLRLRQGRFDEAIAAFEQAIKLDPQFEPAYVNLADALRQIGRDAEGEEVLRQGLALLPRNADLRHTLGLLLVRQGKKVAALKELGEAARLAPENARYAYVYAIALNSDGKRADALATLRGADKLHPNNLEVLSALISISRETGDRQAALRYARQAAVLLPDDPNLRVLIAELESK